MTSELRNQIYEAEEALENMPRASRSRTQLEEKLAWMKTQKARLYSDEAAAGVAPKGAKPPPHSAAGPSSANAGHQAALRLIGGYSGPEAKMLASSGFNVLKTASGATVYKLNGKRSSQAAARKFLEEYYDELI